MDHALSPESVIDTEESADVDADREGAGGPSEGLAAAAVTVQINTISGVSQNFQILHVDRFFGVFVDKHCKYSYVVPY
jgi:hypothetical protein